MNSPTLIVDIGTSSIKAGLQTDALPTVICPSIVGRPRRRHTGEFDQGSVFIGEKALALSADKLSMTHPIDHGHIEDWVDLEEIWNYLFKEPSSSGLNLESTKGMSILLTEPPFASSRHRENLVELAIETYEFHEANLSIQGILALYASGRTTGMVVEIGELTQIVPVVGGFMEKMSVRRNDFGGEELTMYLHRFLCDCGYTITTRSDIDVVRTIKETLCYCALDPVEEDTREDLDVVYTLPDGKSLKEGATELTVGHERFYVCEALFEPRLMEREDPTVIELIWQAVQNSPIEARKHLLASVIVSGGSTMFRNFPKRLENELQRISPPQARSGIKVFASEDRRYGVWLGAKAFCNPSLRRMQDLLWISAEDWFEEGPAVVARKTAFKN